MTTSDHMHNDLQFESDIKGFSSPEQFLARQVRAIILELVPINSRLGVIEKECKARGEKCQVYLASVTTEDDSCGPAIDAFKKRRIVSRKDMVIGGVSGATIAGVLFAIAKAVCAQFGITI